jgi:hypothetical protein
LSKNLQETGTLNWVRFQGAVLLLAEMRENTGRDIVCEADGDGALRRLMQHF